MAPAIETSVIYSVARTESSFDQRHKFAANAVGLMQVTPEVGRDTAKHFGLTYDWDKIVSDPVYTTQMRAAELSALFSEYRGTQIMTFAGYDAGRGRVRDWVQARGDPRDPKVDPVDWIERMPLSGTSQLRSARDRERARLSCAFRRQRNGRRKSEQRVVTHEVGTATPVAAAAPTPWSTPPGLGAALRGSVLRLPRECSRVARCHPPSIVIRSRPSGTGPPRLLRRPRSVLCSTSTRRTRDGQQLDHIASGDSTFPPPARDAFALTASRARRTGSNRVTITALCSHMPDIAEPEGPQAGAAGSPAQRGLVMTTMIFMTPTSRDLSRAPRRTARSTDGRSKEGGSRSRGDSCRRSARSTACTGCAGGASGR